MGLSGSLLSAPVKMSEVKTCIDASSVTSLKSLCTHSNINMWAKYKPVDSPCSGAITEEQRRKVGYGLSAVGYDITDDDVRRQMISAAESGNYGYTYTKPGQIYRICDFIGYNHACKVPFFVRNNSKENDACISVGMLGDLPVNNLTASDLTGLLGQDNSAGGYGIVYRRGTTTNVYYPFDDKNNVLHPVSNDCTIHFATATGTYTACVFIAKIGDPTRGFLIPMPPLTFTVSAPVIVEKVRISAEMDTEKKPRFSFTITNISGERLTSGTAWLRLYDSRNNIKDSFSFSIPALNNNAEYSDELTIEDSGDWTKWEFTYLDVKVNG